MNETRDRLQPHRLGAVFGLGMAVTLLFAAPRPDGGLLTLPPGWFGLWLASTLGAAPLGIMLLVAPAWRDVPIEERRAPAAAYLAACFLNLTALAVMLSRALGPWPWILLPAGFAALAAVLLLRQLPSPITKVDLFP
jgi:hypothetical protein